MAAAAVATAGSSILEALPHGDLVVSQFRAFGLGELAEGADEPDPAAVPATNPQSSPSRKAPTEAASYLPRMRLVLSNFSPLSVTRIVMIPWALPLRPLLSGSGTNIALTPSLLDRTPRIIQQFRDFFDTSRTLAKTH